MTGSEAPAAVLFYKGIRELNNDVECFTLSVALYFCLAGHDRGVIAVNSHLHIVVFENVVMNAAGFGVFDIVGRCGDITF